MCLACNPGQIAFLRSAASRRDFLKNLGVATGSAFLCADPVLAQSLSGTMSDRADILFRGGPILTMSEKMPRAEALAVSGNRIMAVGKLDDVQPFVGPKTQVVDLNGRTLMPGLIDPHMHFVFTVLEDWINISPIVTPDFETVLGKLRQGSATAKEGEWVRGQQFDPSITPGARALTLADLDAIAPRNALFILESNGHVGYANSLAFKAAGVTRDTADPPAARFVRDQNGNLTGRIEEMAAIQVFGHVMPTPTAAEMVARVQRLMSRSASVGCTMLHDNGIGTMAGVKDLALLQAVVGRADTPLRYRGMLISTEMDAWDKAGIKPGHGNDFFRVDGIKAWADGSNQARTGYMRENYLGTDGRGALNYTQAQMTDVIRKAHAGGWQVGVHANGDAAIDVTLDAYEAALGSSPVNDLRHRIEHCSVLHPEQMTRMRQLGLSPSFLIGHVHWWGKAFRDRLLGPERARLYDPCASALRAGLRLSLHSDWNVTPIEPLRYVEDAVTRVMAEGGDVFFPEERISIEAALRAVTIDAAWQCHMDDQVGTLDQGKRADLVLLEQTPTDPKVKIGKIKVSETWMDGVRRHAS